MMYNGIGDIKRIRSLRPTQLGGYDRIAVVEDTPVGADAYDNR
jgi:hypothetical protein